ncbi:type II toxin-antitoxin system RelE/ParE family toxin [Candidatus Uhrbacteria bacterium]|nr:type II toxin-antitoxin system RelE/ParE family toxin [Candidatus Uhrbacteria bacterium]
MQKTLKKIPRDYAERILFVIRMLPADPYFGDLQKMKGDEHSWRRRIGEYRLFYKILKERRLILVFHLERRTTSTY